MYRRKKRVKPQDKQGVFSGERCAAETINEATSFLLNPPYPRSNHLPSRHENSLVPKGKAPVGTVFLFNKIIKDDFPIRIIYATHVI